ncbi:MAG: TonB-dependent receptor [Candidatus Rokuibacteriota bacterium]|nr:MAG: TonB-dependent receptor [Candidatus Rokubacteria bacterium]
MTRRLATLLLGMLTVSPAAAQQYDDPTRLEPVVISVTRIEQKAGEAPASVTVLTRDDIRQSASQTVDDLLRQVPGFSLFRRSSSLVTHPTTQGLSLRGIGPSGTSRALVLVDGVPANDPFGGWVYWSRIPMQGIEQIEVVRGGGSSAWGNYALGGVVHVLTRRPTERAVFFDGSYGTRDTMNFDLLLHEVQGPLRLTLEGNYFDTGGYPVVKESRRGSIDIDADSRHTTFNGRVELVASPEASLFVSGTYFDEERGNGTPLQLNRTGSGSAAVGGRLGTLDDGEWRLTLFADDQKFRSTFSTQALDRNSETLALDQRVPTTSAGGWLQWSRKFGSHLVAAGGDARWVSGETNERVYNAGAFARIREAGGQQFIGGLFVQDVYTPHPAWELVGGLRGDYWHSYDGTRHDTPPAAGVPAEQTFNDIDRIIPSGRVAALFHATPTTDVRASAYQGFRVPTLNEQYRVFRVRNDVTVANESLRPERLTGGELGVQQRWGPLEGRITGYWNEVQDLVANVTLTSRLPDCPVGTTCRQRQNLDLARIRGLETELELRPARDWRLLASYLFADARVVEASQQPGLEGKRLAQVPEHSATAAVRFARPDWFNASLTARFVGDQYEDDINSLPLGSYVVVDLAVSRAFGKHTEVYVAVENLFDRIYTTGRTSEGVISIGEPRVARAGVRLRF